MDKIEAFIIHLARAQARRAQVDRILEVCPIPAQVLDAVDGRAMAQSEIDAVYSRKSIYTPHYPFEMTVGEVGCFLSHRKAWQAIVDKGLDAGLVIEDDVEIDPTLFAPALELAREHISECGVIQFQVRHILKPGAALARNSGVTLCKPVVVPLRASCTLYSKAALEKLLEQTARFDRPIDGYMQMHWITGIRPLIAIPSGLQDKGNEIGGTTIQARNIPLLKRLKREVLRPLYRFRIKSLSFRSDRHLIGSGVR